MAENFIDAVREMHAKLKSAKEPGPGSSPEEIVQAAVDAAVPVIVEIVKKNNVDVVRILRDNPSLLSRAR
jgi:hypothetical protein